MEDSKKIKVVNRTNGSVGYSIPDMQNLHRVYSAKEEKIITFEELRKLSYIPGGETMIKDYLVVKDPEAIEALNFSIEPEYFYTEEQVIKLMQEGTLDQFLDCLDFAPDGVLELIKSLAVSLPLNDVPKRKAIWDKLNFNVDKAIEMNEIANENQGLPRGNNRRAAAPFNADSDQSKATVQNKPRRRVVVAD